MTASQLRRRYATALALAQIVAAVELTALILPLRHGMVALADTVFARDTVVAALVLAVLSTAAVVLYAHIVVEHRLRWFTTGDTPAPRDRFFVRALLRRQSALLTAIWAISGIVLFVVNRDGGAVAAWLIGVSVLFGAATATGVSVLLILRPMRPITAAITATQEGRDTAPGVLSRLLLMWLVTSAPPMVGVGVLVFLQSRGLLIERTASLATPVIVLTVISILVGLRGMTIVALSISDPVRDVVDAMARVERGEIDTRVEVYERSQIGR